MTRTRLERLNEVLTGAQLHKATYAVLTTEDLETLLAVVDAGQHVVKNWSTGDLAGAVNNLDTTIGELE